MSSMSTSSTTSFSQSEETKSYNQIMKATSIFGGVQVIQIIFKIIASKAIAILLGPVGMGVNTLLLSTIGLISNLTNFGLGTSAVKNVSSAKATGDELRVAEIVFVLRRLVWITGLLGTVLVFVLSPYLSEITFGHKDYTLAFRWISISLLINQLSSGQIVVLQGLRKLKYLANAGVTGSFAGLIISIPLYYFWGIDGIVPAIIATSIANLILSWYFSGKVHLQEVVVTNNVIRDEGKDMLKMGFMLSLSGLITTGGSYLFRIYLSNTGGVDEVGLYSAGFTIIGSYVGLIFTAMGTDYYPRLASISTDNHKVGQLVSQQAEIALLILAPILSIFLIYIDWVVIILYSTKFTAISGMIHWAALGIFFKASSWAIAFVFLAKGSAKLFFWNELVTNIYLLGFNIVGYKYWGLDGLGASFLLSYVVYFFQVFYITKWKYKFSIAPKFFKILLIQLMLAIFCFLAAKLLYPLYSYILGSIFILFSAGYSLYEMNKIFDLKELWNKYRKD